MGAGDTWEQVINKCHKIPYQQIQPCLTSQGLVRWPPMEAGGMSEENAKGLGQVGYKEGRLHREIAITIKHPSYMY